MSIKEIKEKSGLKMEVAESLYWHCLWLKDASSCANVQWVRLLKDKAYRVRRIVFTKKTLDKI